MDQVKVYLETGKKKVFASSVDWAGWSRAAADESTAIDLLYGYAHRYSDVLQLKSVHFQIPADVTHFIVIERLKGNVTTDFGAPAVIPEIDRVAIDTIDFERSRAILQACWLAFDQAVDNATGFELSKGPRGGGRNLDKIIDHVIDADKGYLSRLGWKFKRSNGISVEEELNLSRTAVLDALENAEQGNLPLRGPRGGVIWPPRYFVRRVAWHVLDHAWEIEDRIM